MMLMLMMMAMLPCTVLKEALQAREGCRIAVTQALQLRKHHNMESHGKHALKLTQYKRAEIGWDG